MARLNKPLRASEIAELIDGSFIGVDVEVKGISPPSRMRKKGMSLSSGIGLP